MLRSCSPWRPDMLRLSLPPFCPRDCWPRLLLPPDREPEPLRLDPLLPPLLRPPPRPRPPIPPPPLPPPPPPLLPRPRLFCCAMYDSVSSAKDEVRSPSVSND